MIRARHFSFLFAGLIGLIAYQNCAPYHSQMGGGAGASGNSENAGFAPVAALFAAKCVACHQSPTSANGQVGLGDYASVMESGVVVAGNPEGSRLYSSVMDGSMPPTGPLSTAETELIRAWIEQGAQEFGAEPNEAPQISVQASIRVTLPQSEIRIDAVATDDGQIVSQNWSQLDGPSLLVLNGATTASVTLTNFIPGTYQLEFAVADEGGLSARAPVQVQVVAAPTNPTDPTTPPPVMPPPPATPVVTFAQISRDILQPRCLSCHSGARPDAGYSVETYAAVMRAVRAGDAARSRLYTEIQSNSMPENGAPLTNTQKAMVQAWINQGALNN